MRNICSIGALLLLFSFTLFADNDGKTITLPVKQLQMEINLFLEKNVLTSGELSKVSFKILKDDKIAGDVEARLYLNGNRQPLEKKNDGYTGFISSDLPGEALLSIAIFKTPDGIRISSPTIPIKILQSHTTMNTGFPIIAFWDALRPNENAGIPPREKTVAMEDYVEKTLKILKGHHFNAIWSAVPCPTLMEKLRKYEMKTTVGAGIGEKQILKDLEKIKFKIPTPAISAYKTSTAPLIDGNLNDDCWKSANPTGNFILLGATKMADEKTEAVIAYDEQNLYVAFKCSTSDMNKMIREIRKRDQHVWRDDSVEVLLRVNSHEENFFHLIVNSLNTQMDTIHKSGNEYPGWDAPGWRSAVSISPNTWTVEMAIPFKALEVKMPQPGESWNLNFLREAPSHSEQSSWSPSYHNFLNPRMFGTLNFAGTEKPDNAPACTSVSGKVTDSTEKPVKNAIVSIDRFVCLTDEKGKFNFPAIPVGEYEIGAGNIRYELQNQKIRLAPAATPPLAFNLDDSSYLTLGITDTYDRISKTVASYSKRHDNILGYYLIDEPQATAADNIGLANKLFKGLDPQTPTLSCYLGLPAIKTLCDKANPALLLIDVYPLLADSPIGDFKMRGHFLNNMEMSEYIDSARECQKNKKLWVALQAFSSLYPDGKPRFRMPTPKEMKAMAYIAVAHGAKGLAYFIYESVASGESIIGMRGPDGKFSDVWEEVGKINEELEQIAPTLLTLNFDKNIATSSGNTDIQTFSNPDGIKYLILVNKDVTSSQNVTVSINLPQKEKITRIIEIPGNKAISPILNDKTASFEYLTGPGDGKLFRLE